MRDLAGLSARDPSFQDLRARERRAAVATLSCSRRLDAVYERRFQALR